jgi:AcrR family transcriptional regulator
LSDTAPTSPPAVKPAGRYHHGSLRDSLVEWGTHLLDTEGIDAMSLRAAAKAAGVSPAAPSRHFGDKNGLLAAIAAQGFRDLVALRQQRLDAVPAEDTPARLRAVMSGYLDFAVAHPARFQLMFGPQVPRQDHPELQQAAEVSFDLLRQCVRPLVGDTRADGLSADDLAFLVWASTHGLAMLRVNRQRLPVPTRDKDGDRLTDLMVTFVTTALQASSR